MQMILDGLSGLGTATIDPLWRPVLAWTALALPLWALLEQTDRLHPYAEYRLSQLILAALPAGIVAVGFVELLPGATRTAVLPAPSVVVLPPIETTAVSTVSWSWMHAVGLLTIGAVGIGLFHLGRLGLEVLAVCRVRRRVGTTATTSLNAEIDRLRKQLNVGRPVQICTSSDAAVPVTLGGLRPTILMPERLADAPEARRMALRHELIHIRRRDDCAQLVEQFIVALFAAHPLVGRLRRQITEARERACDAAVLDHGATPAGDYARLLTAFADGDSSRRLGSLSLSESSSSLTNRLTAMRSSMPSFLSSRFALGTALVAGGLALTLGVVACSDSIGPSSSTEETTESSPSTTANNDEVYMAVDDQPELVGGMEALQESVYYPEVARRAGLEGQVIVQFVVDEKGTVTNLKVTRGVDEILNESALEAVRQQTFEPGREEGEPVPVQMSLPITFKRPEAGSPETTTRNEVVESPKWSPAVASIEGGKQALQDATSYPDLARSAGIEGTVRITFTVRKSGEIEDARVTKSVHEALDAAALEAVRNVSFTPAKEDSILVPTEMTLPISFSLAGNGE